MKLFNRLIIYICGIFFISLGCVIAIKSKMGVSPMSSLPFSIERVSNISMGVASAIMFCIYVLIQILILKKDFKIIQLLQVIFAIVFGQIIDFLNNLINVDINNFATQMTFCLISVVIVAIGISLTLKAKIVPLAPDGLSYTISTKYDIEFGKVKMCFDGIVIGIAVLILLVNGKTLNGIGIGTIISALMVGRTVQIINNFITKRELAKEDIELKEAL